MSITPICRKSIYINFCFPGKQAVCKLNLVDRVSISEKVNDWIYEWRHIDLKRTCKLPQSLAQKVERKLQGGGGGRAIGGIGERKRGHRATFNSMTWSQSTCLVYLPKKNAIKRG